MPLNVSKNDTDPEPVEEVVEEKEPGPLDMYTSCMRQYQMSTHPEIFELKTDEVV